MKVVVLVAGTNEPGNSDFLADRFIEGMRQYGGDQRYEPRSTLLRRLLPCYPLVRRRPRDLPAEAPAKEGAGRRRIEVEKVRLKDLRIDHFNIGYYEPGADEDGDFQRVRTLIEQSHGFVIATPVWNFSVPAHLKNLIDRMGAFALDATRSKGTLGGKPFFCIFTGGVPSLAWRGLMRRMTSHIPEALQYFGGSYVGHHFEGKCAPGRGKFGLVVDNRPASIEAVRQRGRDFAMVVAGYERTGKAPMRHRARARLAKWAEVILRKVV